MNVTAAGHEYLGAQMIKKILVVDYSVLRQQMYHLVLSRYHCIHVNAMNGREALELLTTQQDIGLILLDLNIALAGMSGLEFLEKIAGLGIIPRVPVILISYAGKEEEASRGVELGVKETLKRPFNPSILHKIIEKVFAEMKENSIFPEISQSQEGPSVLSNPTTSVIMERISWRGVLTQAMSLQLGGDLLNALKNCDTLIVNLDEVELLDYSCLLLLCAVKRQANEKGKEFFLEGQQNTAVGPLFHRIRVNGNRLCRTYCGNSCLFD